MLKQSFCHLPRIGLRTERSLWDSGCLSWEYVLESEPTGVSRARCRALREGLAESVDALGRRDAAFFDSALPSSEKWRLFAEFQDEVAFLDIETGGLSPDWDPVTTVAVYDTRQVLTYVRGRNLDELADDLRRYRLLVTFNGATFDLPFLERSLGIRFDHGHIDLRYVLARLGFRGGLKRCEQALGLGRGELDGVDGSVAVTLWNRFQRKGDGRYLETLLAYNVEDVLNLERLLRFAYNRLLHETPFPRSCCLPEVEPLPNPFRPDPGVLEEVRRLYAW